MSQVELIRLSKNYGQTVAVDAIDLSIRDRELLVLVGPSGCGKTTTLRMIAGLEEITSGEIRIGDRVVNRVPPKDRNIAMVFQNYALYPHMNVYKNMAFGLKMRGVPRAEIERRVRNAASILGIEDLFRRKPGQLSGGQRQRVAVGRAIVREPEVFLFDEPLSNLDAKLRVTMRTELVKLQQRLETTMIHVTHDQTEAMMMGHRVVVMHRGRIQQVGRPMEVYNEPVNRFVAEFIGSPPMNFFEGFLLPRDGGLWFQSDALAVRMPDDRRMRYHGKVGQPVSLGIRPEDISDRPIPAADTDDGQTVLARVLVAQPLGAETILDLQIGDEEFAARVPSDCDRRSGDTIAMRFQVAKAHLFDGRTGSRW